MADPTSLDGEAEARAMTVPIELRVWWIPQVPMEPFFVPVGSVREGVLIMGVLGKYDLFQFENKIKPDYCNTGGLEMLENGEWTDWYDDATNEDDPKAWRVSNTRPAP